MRILFTFELPALSVRAMDYINVLLSFGHEVDIFGVGEGQDWIKWVVDTLNNPRLRHLKETPVFNEYRAWYYDLSTFERWQYPTLFWKELVEYRSDGFMACINYEDGYRFFSDRITEAIQDRTMLFMNNALYLDRTNYPVRARSKLFMTTSYISNSQKFGKVIVPFKDKTKRVFFSGSVTGNQTSLTNFSPLEPRLRVTLVEMVHSHPEISSILRFFSYEPEWKHFFDEIPSELKCKPTDEATFVDELSHSLISLCIKGNSYPTNRFFESMAAGCVTFSTQIDHEIEVYGIGEKGKDYVEIKADGTDLIDKIRFYLDNPGAAEVLASNGRKVWEKYNMLDGTGLFSPDTQRYHIEGIKKITGWDIRTL